MLAVGVVLWLDIDSASSTTGKRATLPPEWMVPVCPVLWLQVVNIKGLVCCGAQTDCLVVRLLCMSTAGVGLQRHEWVWNAGVCFWLQCLLTATALAGQLESWDPRTVHICRCDVHPVGVSTDTIQSV